MGWLFSEPSNCVYVCVPGWESFTVSGGVYGTLQRGATSPGIQAITSFDGFLEANDLIVAGSAFTMHRAHKSKQHNRKGKKNETFSSCPMYII